MNFHLPPSQRMEFCISPMLGCFCIWAVMLSTSLNAQVLEEVTVTAQKREQSLQDVGISVTAFSGEQLENLGAWHTVDLVEQVPGLQVSAFTSAFTVFNLRGVSQNNFQDNLEAPVAVYVDGAYVATMNAVNARMFDMRRVEVLRGPQGTLFGRNTTGGLLHFITRGAEETEFNGYMEATLGEYNQTAIEGAVGGALGDKLRGRIAGFWEQYDGYVQSVTPGIRDSHGANGYTLRGSLQSDFSEDVVGDLRVTYDKDSDVPTGGYHVELAGFDPVTGFGIPTGISLTEKARQHASTLEGRYDRETWNINGTITWSLNDDTEFVSITNYLGMDKSYLEDGAGGFGYFPVVFDNDFHQASEELRLSGQTDRVRWQAGAYFLDMQWDMYQNLSGAIIHGGGSDGQSTETYSVLDSSNWSVFGQIEFDIAPEWLLIAGLRYSYDDKSLEMQRYYSDVSSGIPSTLLFDIANVPINDIDSISYGDVPARLALNWTPTENTLIYASVNRGIKGGNWSIDPLGQVADSNLKHDEEVLIAYELGFKTTFFDGLARLNSAIYYYDYDDYQTFSFTALTPQVANSDATSKGGEIEFAISPTVGWDFQLGAAFIDSEVDAVPDVFGGTVEAEFPKAPGLSLNWLGRYEWPMLGGMLALQVDGNYNGKQYLLGTNSLVSKDDSYSVWNGSLSYTTSDEKLRATLWVKNFTDSEYRLYVVDAGLIGFIEDVYSPPRWWGVTVRYFW